MVLKAHLPFIGRLFAKLKVSFSQEERSEVSAFFIELGLKLNLSYLQHALNYPS